MINRSQKNDPRFWEKWRANGALPPPPAQGMMFFDAESLVAARRIAQAFAGKGGRIATLPDIVDARLAEPAIHAPIWSRYAVTDTAEYFGKSRGGNNIVIVAHGIGPLADTDRFVDAETVYNNGIAPKQLRITKDEFRSLESGTFGDVKIFDAGLYFDGDVCDARDARMDLKLKARLGPRANEYIERLAAISRGVYGNDCILKNDESYEWLPRMLEDKFPGEEFYGGSLLTITQLANVSHWHERPRRMVHTSVAHDIDVGAVESTARFVGVRGKGRLGRVHEGIDAVFRDVKAHLPLLMVPADVPESDLYMLSGSGLLSDMNLGDLIFASPKQYGGVIPEDAPLLRVTAAEEIAGPATFRTTVPAYYGWVKYDTSEVKAIAPPGANAFRTGEWRIIEKDGNPEWHEAPITFYKVDVDRTKRLLEREEVQKDLGLTLKLLSV